MSIISIIADRFLEDFLSDISNVEASKAPQRAATEPYLPAASAQLSPQPAQLSFQPTQLSITAPHLIANDR